MSDTLSIKFDTYPDGTYPQGVTFNSADYNIYVLDNNDDDVAEPDYEYVSIPGRDGDLTLWNGKYKNKMITYTCYCSQNAKTNIPAFMSAILASPTVARIEDTIHSDYFKQGTVVGGNSPVYSDGGATARFELTFNCKPQKWLKSGEQEVEITGTSISSATRLTNPTVYPAIPLLEITGYGTCQLSYPNYKLTIDSGAGSNVILHDCDTNHTYRIGTNASLNSYATVVLPALWADRKGFAYLSAYRASTMTLKIIPRWWKL